MSLSALELAGRLRKPVGEERRVWKLVCHVFRIVALRGKKPKEFSGPQPERTAPDTLKSAEAYKRMREQQRNTCC